MNPEPSSSSRWVSVAAVVALALCTVVCVGLIQLTEPEAQREGAVRRTAMLVEVARAERGTFRPTLTATGTVRAVDDLAVAPRVGGHVARVAPELVPGSVVPAGTVLVGLDPVDLRLALAQQRSALQQAEAQLAQERGRQAVAQAERAQIDGALTPEQEALILRQPQLQASEAAVAAARARVRQAEADLARTEVVAPFDALVLERRVSVGAQVSAGQPVARLVAVDRFWVELTMPTAQLVHLTDDEGRLGEVALHDPAWGGDAVRWGQVQSVVRLVDEQTRLARVLVAVDDPLALGDDTEGPPLTVGAFVQARVQAAPLADVVRIERPLLRRGDTVWLVGADDALEVREVQVVLQDETHAYLSGGVQPDERIVATDLSTVSPGVPLRTVTEGSP
jgi:RND family efflux transporter MFP subunit